MAGLHHQVLERFRSLAQTLGPALETVGPFVDLGHRHQAIFLLGRAQQAERYRHTGGAIGPVQRQQPEPAVVAILVMIVDTGQKLHFFAAVAVVERVIDDEKNLIFSDE